MKTKPPFIHLFILFVFIVGNLILFYLTDKKLLLRNKLTLEISQQTDNINRLNELETSLPTLAKEMQILSKTLPTTEVDIANFASAVERIARESGLISVFHFDDFAQSVAISKQNVPGLGIAIDLNGNFQGVIGFLSKLSRLLYFYKIDKITITKNENKPGIKAVLNGFLITNIEKK